MKIKELLSELGINNVVGSYSKDGKSYIIDIDNSNEYNRYYSRLTRSDLLEEDEDSSTLNIKNSNQIFIGDDFQVSLQAEWDDDRYKLVIKEIRGED